MALKLTLADGLGGRRQTKVLAAGTISLGRGPGNDWVLPDPERHLSKTHCVIGVEGGRYVLTDLSTNGVYVNGASQPTARDSRVVLTDGDEVRLGDYAILCTETDDPAPGRHEAPEGEGGVAGRGDGGPLDVDPLALPPDPSFRHPVGHPPSGRRAEDPFDAEEERKRRPLDPDADLFRGVSPPDAWRGPPQGDRADAPAHAFPAPRLAQPPGEIDFDALIGDLSSLLPATHPQPPAPAAGPVPDAETSSGASDAPASRPSVPSPAAAADARAGLAAFLAGAGVPGPAAGDADPEAALRAAGEIFRVMAEGLRELLMSRAAIKGEMRVEQTLIRPHDNNALKFSVNADEAVAALLGGGRPGYLPPLAAARGAFDDVKSHELAVMAGVQTALLALLRRLDPAALEARLAAPGLLDAVRPTARKAHHWEMFRRVYADIAREAEDDFQAVFGRAFARAYSAQTREGQMREGRTREE